MGVAIPTDDLIDRVLEHHEHTQTNIPARRAAVLGNVKKAVSFIWNHRNWAFRQRTDTGITVGTDGLLFLSSRFLSFGAQGGIYIPGNRVPLQPIPQREYNEIIAMGIPAPSTPRAYAELNYSGGVRTIGLVPLPAAAIDVSVSYDLNSPPITDDDPGGLGDDNDTIPAEWHETCVYEGTIYYQMKDKANAQSRSEQWELFMAHLRHMTQEERGGRAGIHRFAPFNPRRRRR